jgi:YCII-related domain
MKNYIVLFREPDGRKEPHPQEDIARHQENWKRWFGEWGAKGNLAGGSEMHKGVHRVGEEIVGGFLLLKADSLDEAAGIALSCPIYEFGGYAEVREMQS